MSPSARDENDSLHAGNRTSTLRTSLLVALVASLSVAMQMKLLTVLQPDWFKKNEKAVAKKDEEHAHIPSGPKVFGTPFLVPVQTKYMKESQECPVMFLNKGFDLQVNNCRFELEDLFVENTAFSPERIQSTLRMVNPDGLTHVEYDKELGLILHAGEQCSICIPLEETKKMFTTLAFSANTGDVRCTKTCNGLSYRFLKMPPMASFLLSERGSCSIVLNQVPLEGAEQFDNRVAHSLK